MGLTIEQEARARCRRRRPAAPLAFSPYRYLIVLVTARSQRQFEKARLEILAHRKEVNVHDIADKSEARRFPYRPAHRKKGRQIFCLPSCAACSGWKSAGGPSLSASAWRRALFPPFSARLIRFQTTPFAPLRQEIDLTLKMAQLEDFVGKLPPGTIRMNRDGLSKIELLAAEEKERQRKKAEKKQRKEDAKASKRLEEQLRDPITGAALRKKLEKDFAKAQADAKRAAEAEAKKEKELFGA